MALVLHWDQEQDSYVDGDFTEYVKIDGSQNWPDWSNVEECTCGAPLPDVCEGNCPKCGQPYWHLITDTCETCGTPIHYDAYYWLGEWGDVHHEECVTIAETGS